MPTHIRDFSAFSHPTGASVNCFLLRWSKPTATGMTKSVNNGAKSVKVQENTTKQA